MTLSLEAQRLERRIQQEMEADRNPKPPEPKPPEPNYAPYGWAHQLKRDYEQLATENQQLKEEHAKLEQRFDMMEMKIRALALAYKVRIHESGSFAVTIQSIRNNPTYELTLSADADDNGAAGSAAADPPADPAPSTEADVPEPPAQRRRRS